MQRAVLGFHKDKPAGDEAGPSESDPLDLEVRTYKEQHGGAEIPQAELPQWYWYAHRQPWPLLYKGACRALTVAATSVKSE